MDALKFDAALAGALAHKEVPPAGTLFEVSVRTKRPLTEAEAAELRAAGAEGADAGRSIFPARVSLAELSSMSEKACVARVALAQQLRPLAPPQH